MLRKRSAVFHKLPNGTWGLKEWYPNAKSSKAGASNRGDEARPTATDDDDVEQTETATQSKNGAAVA
jgi:hypothetical protein